jgi:hypothetical protein
MVLESEASGIIFPAVHDESFKVDSRFTYVSTDMPVAAMDSNFGTSNNAIWIKSAVVAALCCAPSQPTEEENPLLLLFDQDIEDAILITSIGMKLDVTARAANSKQVNQSSTVHCLLIGSMTEADWESDDGVTYLCTCVLRKSEINSNSLERIGILDIREDTGIFHSALEVALKLT